MRRPADKFDRGRQAMDRRVAELLSRVARTKLPRAERDLLSSSVQELSTAVEELHVAQEELRVQNEELLATRLEVEAERQRYRELFEFAPDGYFVTDPYGIVQEVNRSALAQLKTRAGLVQRRPIVSYVLESQRRQARQHLLDIAAQVGTYRLEWRMQPRRGEPFDADVTASSASGADGKVHTIRWLVRDVTQVRMAGRELSEAQSRLRAMTAELSIVEERERRQIAVEIHDRISQNLALAKMRVSALRGRCPADAQRQLRTEFDMVGSLLDQTLEDTRTLTFELSPPILYELGLLPALQWLAEQMQRQYGLRVVVDGKLPPAALNEDLRGMLFRAVRELLINVVKHADASAARVSVRCDALEVRLTVADDGSGFDPGTEPAAPADRRGGFGLFSLRTRIEQLGGKVEVSSIPGNGTRVTLSIATDTSAGGRTTP